MVVTLDAMGTQRAIAADIVKRGGDYILAVKGNQGRLHDEIRDQFDFALRQLAGPKLDSARWTAARTEESGHDRTETRSVLVCHDLEWMSPDIRADWSGLASIIMVHRHTLLGGGKTRSETSYYISSLKETRAAAMLGYIRRRAVAPANPEPLEHREPLPLGARCHLSRGPQPNPRPHRRRQSGHHETDGPQRPQPHAIRR